MNKKRGFPESGSYTTFSVSLSEDTELFLDQFKDKIRSLGGGRVSRSEIIRAALRYIRTLRVDLRGVRDESDIFDRFVEAARRT